MGCYLTYEITKESKDILNKQVKIPNRIYIFVYVKTSPTRTKIYISNQVVYQNRTE